MSKHTPEPWYLWPDETDGTRIATIPPPDKEFFDLDHEVLGCSEWLRLEDADAEHIVACVNALPELLATLKAATERLKNVKFAPDALIWECEAAIAKAPHD